MNEEGIKFLGNLGFIRPNDFGSTTEIHLNDLLKRINKEIQMKTAEVNGNNRKINKTPDDLVNLERLKKEKKFFMDYKHILSTFLDSLKYQTGKGIYFNNPHQLLNRLELLAGSILAGNNGVIPALVKIY